VAPSNVARLYWALQAVKGTPAAAPQYSTDFSGGAGPALTRTIGTRDLTGLGRETGNGFVQMLAAAGSVTLPVFPKTSGFFAYAAQGGKVTTGAGPYTHALTGANTQPYLTVWKAYFNGIKERVQDVKVTSLAYAWAAGGDLVQTIDMVGTLVVPVATIPAGSVYDGGEPLRVPDMVYDIDGDVIDTVTGGTLAITTPHEGQQTDKIYPSYIMESGPRSYPATFTELYLDPDRYNLINFGNTTPVAAATDIRTGNLTLTFGNFTTGPALRFDADNFAFETIDLSPAANAGVLTQAVGGRAYRVDDDAGPTLTVTAVNDVATYTAA
jgi:hypothetical protein